MNAVEKLSYKSIINEKNYLITRISTEYAVLKELKTGRIEKIRY